MTTIGPPAPGHHYGDRTASDDEIIDAAAVVEQILDRVVAGWRTAGPVLHSRHDRWDNHVEAARRAQVLLRRQDEVQEKLGDNAPQLDAGQMHPWIWDGARSLWQSGHFREAVGAAARKVNAEVQNKVGRRDISETDLFKQVFTLDPPQPGKPRLRMAPNDGSKTFQSVHRGAAAFAEGCYAAMRNPISHIAGELPEAEALEQLAAFSVLARWVDGATIESASV